MQIKIDQLSDAIEKELDEYAKDTTDVVKDAVKKAANEAVKELKQKSPKRTGKYAKSWRKRIDRESSSGIEMTVYAGLYQLTHLLEKGHALRGGGRARAFPHIKPVEEKVTKQLEEDIKRGVSSG